MALLTGIALIFGPNAVSAAVAAPPKLSVSVTSLADTVDTGARIAYNLRVECSNIVPGDCVQPAVTLPVPQSADGSVVAHTPKVEQQWVESAELNAAGDAYVITLSDMKPGDSRLLSQTWLIDNYTVPNGVEIEMADPSATFTDENGVPQAGDVKGGPETVTTHAERIVTVNKTMVDPSYADRVTAGTDVTYRVNAYIPAGTNGTIGIQKVVMVDTFDADATVVDAAGGTVSGNTITWEIDVDPAQQPLGAANSIVARDVTLHYPASMRPAVDSGLTREVVNRLDATVDFIDGGQETGSGLQEHAFIGPASAPSGSLHTEPRISAMNHAANGFDTAVLNNDSTTEWSYTLDGWWRDIPNEGWVQRPEYTRNLFVAHRMACWDQDANDGEGQWLAPQIGTEGGNATNVFLYFNRPNAFANSGDLAPWLAQPEVEQCQSPGFKLDRIEVDDMGAPSEGWNGGARRGDKVAAINVAYWDTATNSGGTAQLLTPGGLHDSTVEVYGTVGARNLGLSSTQTVTDIVVFYEALMQREGQSRDGDGGGSGAYVEEDRTNKVKLWGTSTQAFVDSDRTSQSLRATSFVSHQRNAAGEPTDLRGNVNYGVVWQTALRAGSTVMNFNRFFTDLEVSKNALSDVSAVKPGDVIRWEISAGLGDANGTQLVTPRVVDVLPVGLEYVPGSTAIDHPSGSEPVSVEPEVGTVEIDGDTRQTLTWEFDERFQPGDEATIAFDTTVTLAASAGAHSGDDSQQVYVFDTEGPLSLLGSGVPTDVYDLDDDGDTAEHVGQARRDWTVVATSGATIEKFVSGSQGTDLGVTNEPSIGASEWSKAGVSAATTDDSGTWVDFRLDVANNGTRELFDTVVYDVLPHDGDTAIGADLQGEARASGFDVTFRELLDELPDGVTVEFSTSNNPPRPELFAGTGVEQDGANGGWTSALPDGDPTAVRALKYTIESLKPGDRLELRYRADIPQYEFGTKHPAQATDLSAEAADREAEYAWNNLAFRTHNSDGPLLAAEAPKVSVRSILGEIGDYAWFDANNNGLQDAGEKPAQGVVFQLVDASDPANPVDVVDVNGDPVRATTNADGEYSFEVPIGTWAVTVVEIPENYALAKANAGDDDAADSDATALNVPTAPVTITKDRLVDHTLDAGLVGVVSVGDYVWSDTDRDGIQDSGEPGIEGVELTLTGPDGQPVIDVFGNPVAPVETNAEGKYTFENLPALQEDESYTVTVTKAPENHAPTKEGAGNSRGKDSSTGSAATDNEEIDLTVAGERDATLDFGFVPVVSVGDRVWIDTNNNGRQDADEPGLGGVTLTILGPDGKPAVHADGTEAAAVTTNAEGLYTFVNLPALKGDETYTVKIGDLPAGYVPAKESVGDRAGDSSTASAVTDNEEVDLSVPGARDDTLDFGVIPAVSVGDFVWYDRNGDGIQDADEPGIEGVRLRITGPDGAKVVGVDGNPVIPTVTDEDGFYSFDGLPALPAGQHYTVHVTDPAGYTPTKPGEGDDRGKDSSTGSAESVDLTAPEQRDDTLDFGFIGSVSVGDYVWFDQDADGIQDSGEEGLEGVELTLTGPDGQPVTDIYGNVVSPVTTDGNGFYEFTGLPVLADGESYTVTVSGPPTGYAPTKPGEGTDRAKDSSTGSAASEGLTGPGQRDETLDFGFVGTVSVGDYVWSDTNGDGVQDAGEPGIPGVELTLTDADGKPVKDAAGNPVAPVTTDENGFYEFTNLPTLPEGEHYTVTVSETPKGYEPTKENVGDPATDSSTGSADSKDLTEPGDRDDTLDFGFVPAVSVGDFVWYDTNGDGLQDEGEPGIKDVELTLTGPDGQEVTDVTGKLVSPVKTDENGVYFFEKLPVLPAGQSYTVTVKDPAGFVPTTPNAGDPARDSSTGSASSGDLTTPGAVDSTLDFGFVGMVSVGDYVWFDQDADGVQDNGEKGLEGVVLTLTGPDGESVTDVNGNPVAPVTTDADGFYEFTGLPVLAGGGSYTVSVAQPSGYAPTKPGQGSDRAKDSSTGSAASEGLSRPGERDATLDFGFVGTVSVGDFVWKDTNTDGIQDEGEPGIPGVRLELTGPDGKPVKDADGNLVQPVVTDENGFYEFSNLPTLPEGESYTVSVKNPKGLAPTKPGVGDDRAKDSSTGRAESGDLTDPGQSDVTLDFGFVDAAPDAEIVKTDEHGNDANTPEEAVTLPDGSTGLVFTITNDGNEDLVDLVVTDAVTAGTGSVDGLVCVFPGGSTGTSWAGPFLIGASFECTAELTGVEPGTTHTDVAKVTGKGRWSGEPVEPEDPFEGGNPGRVSVGDFVWFDVDEDGVQDPGEPGIADVVLTLVGPDGGPVTDVHGKEVAPTRTDRLGEYAFTDLPVLVDGESYTVRVSNPEGYSPTKPGATGRDKDSSNGEASSEGLTENGQSDVTLDFGFVTGNPNIDIEKGDEAGNDADTKEEAVSLPNGSTGLEFTVVNTGNEDLVDVVVSDEVTDGTGSVDGLVCTFPDGSTGTSWDGPFLIGASFDCVAELTGVEPGSEHTDVATVTGKAQFSGVPVDDDDPYEGGNPGRVSVGDYVWSDTDNDGVQDAGEPGIEGVTLILVGPDGKPVTDVYGNEVSPVVTDENGAYSFDELPVLPAGESYTVKVTDPSGYVPAKENVGDDRGADSSTGEESSGDLTKHGDRDDTLDFGFVPTVSVGDYVWSDEDYDGIQDEGEPGIPGVTLVLVGPDGEPVKDVFGNEVVPVTTDENGFYEFGNLPVLPEGEHYTVKVTDPEGYKPTKPGQGDDRGKDSSTGEAESTDLSKPGDRDESLDFGFIPTVSVGDFVWSDEDRDGIQDAGEPGIEGVELTLTGPDGNPVTDVDGNVVGPVVTDENGFYEFTNLPVLADGESYTVTVSNPPAGFQPTLPGQGGNRGLDSATGQDSSQGLTQPGQRDDTLDFGFIPAVSVGDFVWSDTDRDGVQDEGEPGFPGVTLVLVGPDGEPVKDIYGNEVPPVVTDESGFYEFTNLPTLPEGQSYTVKVTDTPAGFVPTVPGAGDDRGKDSSTGEAPSGDLSKPGDRDDTLDFGFVPAVSVGDFVWSDVNKDGVQDEGEPGIPGVVLTLTGPDGQPAVDVWGNPVPPVVTDENGYYSFTNLPVLVEGESYTVKIDRDGTLKENPKFGGFLPTVSNATTRDLDSDEWEASSEGLTTPGESDVTLDFGFIATTPIIDVEKLDAAGNDADTKDESVALPDGETTLVFEVANLGNEDLVDITVTDEIVEGTGTVTGLVCVFPDGTTGTSWAGPFLIGDGFSCEAELTGVEPGTSHLDRVTVTGKGRWSGTPVEDPDDYNGHTPDPGIEIVKVDEAGNDANTAQETVKISGPSQGVVFTITNTGDEALRDVTVSDKVTDGSATVDGLVCVFPDKTTGTTWAGPLAVGESFTCTATVTGLVENDQHTDLATVTGIGIESGKTVTDDDPYNVIRVPVLATTGGQVSLTIGLIAILLTITGGLLLAVRKRRHNTADA